ncbi:MAG TPA: DUF692 domain-containing protein [Alphaproteobacteria bacterium]|jgi:uncharacterized protein|nr:DUF692 domain-containing protein [Micavibrio sp.]HQX27109.1 DUF692 domain-containing protein [Alphaproteobacteria bacterium]
MVTRINHENNLNKFPPATLPSQPVGIGLRYPYYKDALETDLELGWLEVHPENYFGGGTHRHFLSEARKKYQLSLHGVGLSLGSTDPVSETHLQSFKELIEIFQPFNVSDHASWSASGNAHLNDLLPLPYTHETLDTLCLNITRTQEFLGRKILVENPSTYVAFAENDMTEYQFMNRAAEMTGCGLLLDINNIYVQAHNHGYDAWEYIENINTRHVGEMHLAGHSEHKTTGKTILIDTHNRPVRGEVWDLYEFAVRRFGAIPTLIEWDQDFPTLDILVAEADKARAIIRNFAEERIPHAAE